MRTTTMMIAVATALMATPALASHVTPQTFSSGPGSAGTIQQQDMQRSGILSQQADRANEQASVPTTTQTDSMDPQMNPRTVVK